MLKIRVRKNSKSSDNNRKKDSKMQITLDMETRSRVDLGKCGVYRYAEDCSTEMLCMAVKVDDVPSLLWVGKNFRHLLNPDVTDLDLGMLVKEATTIIAHNAEFERVMWQGVMVRYGFAAIPDHKWKCTAAKAAALALPRSLDGVCQALGLEHQKNKDGRRVMLKMCKPRKPTKHNDALWHEDPKEFKILCDYCTDDVEAEYELDQVLPDLNEHESEVYAMDQAINQRGVYVDAQGIETLVGKIGQKEQNLLREVGRITNGVVTSTRQVAKTLAWLDIEGIELPNLQKATVEKALEGDVSGKAKRLLEIRQSLAKSSVAKLNAMQCMRCEDGRVRGTTQYHTATTGRWGGRGIQPHNYPRDSFSEAEVNIVLKLSNSKIDKAYGSVFFAASKCLRGMLCAAPGRELLCVDFASIEAVGLAWLAFEKKVLADFEAGLDGYIVAASDVFQIDYEDIDDGQRFIGKTVILACGYQGWVDAFRRIANATVDNMTDEEIGKIILTWRKARWKTVALWKGLNAAAIAAVKTEERQTYGWINYGMDGDFLYCELPSGRRISYYKPEVRLKTDKYGRTKENVTFMGIDSITYQWKRQSTYGGKLTENVVQAIARDVLADAMLRCEEWGYKVVFHVHDEPVVELVKGAGTLEELSDIVAEVPAWATGLPLRVSGWVGKRYRKD